MHEIVRHDEIKIPRKLNVSCLLIAQSYADGELVGLIYARLVGSFLQDTTK